jgi:hypothetical protein
MMQRKLILAALALVLTISSASAQENPYRLPQMPAQATSFNKLLYAYRLYAFVKDCNLAVYINEIELDRARLKVQSAIWWSRRMPQGRRGRGFKSSSRPSYFHRERRRAGA